MLCLPIYVMLTTVISHKTSTNTENRISENGACP